MKFKLAEDWDRLEEDLDSEGNNLSEQQVNYFKNSKVRDSKGRLLKVYHGSPSLFDVFKLGQGGFHFGSLQQAKRKMEIDQVLNPIFYNVYLNISSPLPCKDLDSFHPHTLSLWLQCEGIITEQEGQEIRDLFDPIRKSWNKEDKMHSSYDTEACKKLLKLLSNKGYDGLVYQNLREASGKSYMCFYPNQIKSVENKKPTSSANINK